MVKEEVKRTVQFHNANSPDNPIKPNTMMLVSGELVDEPELYEALADELGFKASLLASPLKCMKQIDPSHHLVNIGLALKVLVREAGPLLPNFNTLPMPYQPKQIPMNRLLAIPAAGVAVGIIVLLAITIQNAAGDIQSMQEQVKSNNFLLEKKQAQKKDLTQNIAATEQQIISNEQARKNFMAALESFSKKGDLMNSDMRATVDSVIEDLALGNIAHSGTQVSLNGFAGTEQEILDYARILDATDRFTEITISSITRNENREGEATSDNGSMDFALNLKLKDVIK